MIPQTSDVVVENADLLPDDLERALTILSIFEEFFTSQELLKAFKEKYPTLVAIFYTMIYQQLLEQNADHLLVRVKEIPARALDAVAGSFYKRNGLGRPPEYTGSQLVRVLMVRWLMLWSYEVTSTRLRYDWLARWFAGLDKGAFWIDHHERKKSGCFRAIPTCFFPKWCPNWRLPSLLTVGSLIFFAKCVIF
ncbi:MAG: hypothetical protein ACPGWR_24670 [Ardenticatenaceae bacterium]